jgi:hypothetical protein
MATIHFKRLMAKISEGMKYGEKKTLAREAKVPIPRVQTIEDAGRAIDDLLRQVPLRQNIRMAIFAALRDTKYTKDDLYAAVGVQSLSDGSGATEADGQKALRWLKGEAVEVRRAAVAPAPLGRPSGRPGVRTAGSPAPSPAPAPTAPRPGLRPELTGSTRPGMRPSAPVKESTPDTVADRLPARGLVREFRCDEAPCLVLDSGSADSFDCAALTDQEMAEFQAYGHSIVKTMAIGQRPKVVKYSDWKGSRK